jgi:hypothetical protein
MAAEILQRIDVEYSADSTEVSLSLRLSFLPLLFAHLVSSPPTFRFRQFCPEEGAQDLLAVGLYQLKDDPKAVEGDDTPKLRIGRILLMQLR